MAKTKNNKRDLFVLKKAKILQKEVDLHFETIVSSDAEVRYIHSTHVDTATPHPDFAAKLKSIKPFMAEIIGLKSPLSVIGYDKFNANQVQKNIAEKIYQNNLEKLEITGISLSGRDESRGVIITALLTAPNNMKMAVNSCRIKLNDSEKFYEWIDELNEIVTAIEDEAFAYIYKGKQAQLEVAFPETDKEEK
jgi:hypothetical protein